jgi:hypothetical protein
MHHSLHLLKSLHFNHKLKYLIIYVEQETFYKIDDTCVKDLLDLLQFPLQSTIYLEATKFLADTENEENLMECQKDSFLDRLTTAKIELQPDKTCENDEAYTYTFSHGSLLQTVMPYLSNFLFFSTLFCHKLYELKLS